MLVRDCMSHCPKLIEADALVREAAEQMRALDIGVLPVVAHDRLVGMITDRDITVRARARGRAADTTCVREIMTPGVVSCFTDETLEEATAQMVQQSVRRLVVLDRELQIVGLLSVDDLAVQSENPALIARVLARAAVSRGSELDGVLPGS